MITWLWYQKLIDLRKLLRASGLLDQKYIRTISDSERGIYQLRYQRGSQWLLLVVRLSASAEAQLPAADYAPLGGLPECLLLDSQENSVSCLQMLANHARVFVDGETGRGFQKA